MIVASFICFAILVVAWIALPAPSSDPAVTFAFGDTEEAVLAA